MENELTIRLSIFLGTLVVIAVWEFLLPRRQATVSRLIRWYSNLGIVVVSSALLRWLFPILAVGLAHLATQRGWGLFNNFRVPYELAFILSVLLLDMTIYFQHLVFHMVPRLWLLHRMHHTDMDFDVTTALRFHPIEIILSMFVKMSVVVVLGPPVLAVLVFELILNSSAMFNHGNIRLPGAIDRILRLFIVTPDMHRVHHSIMRRETDSNYGFFLSWWDKLFGTYRDQPEQGHENMAIGIELFRNPKYSHLHWLLIQPFINKR